MFTPPPSPLPVIRRDPTPLPKPRLPFSIGWTIVLVPLALTVLAVSTRFWVHPAFVDLLLADSNHEWINVANWSLHEPHGAASNYLFKRSTSKRFRARDATTPMPPVPADPPLPTPFPQAFDETLSTNFSTTSCYNFFLNMTQTNPFSSCRPFSLLSTSSYAFSQVIVTFASSQRRYESSFLKPTGSK